MRTKKVDPRFELLFAEYFGTIRDYCAPEDHVLQSQHLNRITRAQGIEVSGDITFIVEAGRIISVSEGFGPSYGANVFEPLRDWVVENHPDSARVMFEDSAPSQAEQNRHYDEMLTAYTEWLSTR